MKNNLKFFGLLGAVFLLLAFASDTRAVLSNFGGVDPSDGFPVWYQDSNSLILEKCLDLNGFCLLGAVDLPNGAGPVSFPTNYPPEIFYWTTDSAIDNGDPNAVVSPAGISALMVLAMEGAFGGELAVPGEQSTFGRVRFRIDVPAPGTYTVDYPYGSQTFVVDAIGPGPEVRNAGADIGCFAVAGIVSCDPNVPPGNPVNFGVALRSGIGPFLTWDTFNANPALSDPLLTDPVTGARYVGNPGIGHAIIGSPVGQNFLRITGPGGVDLNANLPGVQTSIETNLFTVSGKVFSGVIPSVLAVDRVTYSRTVSGQVDVFATSAPTATLDVSGGLNLPAAPVAMTGNGAGKFFASIPVADASVLPPSITVTAERGLPSQSQVTANLIDVVSITKAEFNTAASTLTIEASSSDKAAPPTLTATGLGVVSAGSLVVTGVTVPPATVTVTSSKGGSDMKGVTVVSAAVVPPTTPSAANDIVATNRGVAVNINVLANDAAVAPATLAPGTVTIVAQPVNGVVVVNPATGVVAYTPNVNFVGSDSFTYAVRDNLGVLSNVASVSLTVIALPNVAPVAANDAVSLLVGSSSAISVLANDVDSDGVLDPASVVVVAQPVSGVVVVNPVTGVVTYTPNVNFVGSDSFTYNVKDNLGAASNTATVSITVNAIPNVVPIAQNDIATTPKGTAVAISVLANDVDSDGVLDPASVVVVAQPVSGVVVVNPVTGVVTYTPNVNFVGSDTFTYTVKDNLGAVSNIATVRATVTGTSEVVTVTAAEYTRASNTWFIRGTSSAPVRNRISIRMGPTLTGQTVGTANVDASGSWLLIKRGVRLTDPTNTISLQSTQGTILTGVPVLVK